MEEKEPEVEEEDDGVPELEEQGNARMIHAGDQDQLRNMEGGGNKQDIVREMLQLF